MTKINVSTLGAKTCWKLDHLLFHMKIVPSIKTSENFSSAINKISKNAFLNFTQSILLTGIGHKMYIFTTHTFMVNWLANIEPMFEDK